MQFYDDQAWAAKSGWAEDGSKDLMFFFKSIGYYTVQ